MSTPPQRTTRRPIQRLAPPPSRAGKSPRLPTRTATRHPAGRLLRPHVHHGWLYLATVIDIASRRLIGWSIGTHLRTELIVDALDAAVAARGGDVAGVVFHSDRGTQYTSTQFAPACDRHGIRRSMGRVGSSYDNAGLKRSSPR